jgi:hypothetical protein
LIGFAPIALAAAVDVRFFAILNAIRASRLGTLTRAAFLALTVFIGFAAFSVCARATIPAAVHVRLRPGFCVIGTRSSPAHLVETDGVGAVVVVLAAVAHLAGITVYATAIGVRFVAVFDAISTGRIAIAVLPSERRVAVSLNCLFEEELGRQTGRHEQNR